MDNETDDHAAQVAEEEKFFEEGQDEPFELEQEQDGVDPQKATTDPEVQTEAQEASDQATADKDAGSDDDDSKKPPEGFVPHGARS